MKKIALLVISALLISGAFFSLQSQPNTSLKPVMAEKAKMQVVFALDATGSMRGLMDAAKDKIWSIANSLTQADPAPDIEVGIIFYRDRGDAFVTKLVPLTDSLDYVYKELMKMTAQGGGDGPESVNQGLFEAVTKFNWDTATSVYKTVFLIGDFPPHMDYKNDIPYQQTCQIARGKDIVLNTILMGDNNDARKIWEEIAACNQGGYVQVNMNANDIKVATPYDSVIAVLSDSLDALKYYYGNTTVRLRGNASMKVIQDVVVTSSVNVKAQRAEYNTKYKDKNKAYAKAKSTSATSASNELLDDMEAGYVKLDTIAVAALPDNMQRMSVTERAAFVQSRMAYRDSLQKQMNIQIQNRNNFIEQELAKRSASEVKSSLNGLIFENIRGQAEKKKIILKGKAKY
ncbi:MAG: hypothetical protein JWQ27_1778 [Ferruginibacter sp.]|nr:hypothetical protein [Ferruginibacter sp.]